MSSVQRSQAKIIVALLLVIVLGSLTALIEVSSGQEVPVPPEREEERREEELMDLFYISNVEIELELIIENTSNEVKFFGVPRRFEFKRETLSKIPQATEVSEQLTDPLNFLVENTIPLAQEVNGFFGWFISPHEVKHVKIQLQSVEDAVKVRLKEQEKFVMPTLIVLRNYRYFSPEEISQVDPELKVREIRMRVYFDVINQSSSGISAVIPAPIVMKEGYLIYSKPRFTYEYKEFGREMIQKHMELRLKEIEKDLGESWRGDWGEPLIKFDWNLISETADEKNEPSWSEFRRTLIPAWKVWLGGNAVGVMQTEVENQVRYLEEFRIECISKIRELKEILKKESTNSYLYQKKMAELMECIASDPISKTLKNRAENVEEYVSYIEELIESQIDQCIDDWLRDNLDSYMARCVSEKCPECEYCLVSPVCSDECEACLGLCYGEAYEVARSICLRGLFPIERLPPWVRRSIPISVRNVVVTISYTYLWREEPIHDLIENRYGKNIRSTEKSYEIDIQDWREIKPD